MQSPSVVGLYKARKDSESGHAMSLLDIVAQGKFSYFSRRCLWGWSGTAGLSGLEKGRGGWVDGLNGNAFRALVMKYHACW